MSARAKFSDATRADLAGLRRSVCTKPEKRRYNPGLRRQTHPREWELETQSHLRAIRLPLSGTERLLLAKERDQITAAIHFETHMESREAFIKAVAVHCDFRGRGYGACAIESALELVAQDLGKGAMVTAFIHPWNNASQEVFLAAGFKDSGIRRDV